MVEGGEREYTLHGHIVCDWRGEWALDISDPSKVYDVLLILRLCSDRARLKDELDDDSVDVWRQK